MIATIVRDGKRDEVAVEEPLEIRVDGVPLAVMMRTPGHDEELALGFLHGEGLIDGPRRAGPTDDFANNIVVVRRDLLAQLPDALRQPAFERTDGLHATALFSPQGELEILREDVGRHNAMDKMIGRALLDGRIPLSDAIVCVSGRIAFELVQKAAVAGSPILVGVGAPSSLAIELAADRGMTLAGFARKGRVNVFTGGERVRG